jgi:hypothetical protein
MNKGNIISQLNKQGTPQDEVTIVVENSEKEFEIIGISNYAGKATVVVKLKDIDGAVIPGESIEDIKPLSNSVEDDFNLEVAGLENIKPIEANIVAEYTPEGLKFEPVGNPSIPVEVKEGDIFNTGAVTYVVGIDPAATTEDTTGTTEVVKTQEDKPKKKKTN